MKSEPEARSLRTFIAVELPDEVRTALGDVMDVLRAAGARDGLRWVRTEGIHVTLKFLGATSADKLPSISSAIADAARAHAPFELQPAGLGSFHGGRREHLHRGTRESYHYNLRVVWTGVTGDLDALRRLASSIEERVAPLGFPTEKRPFTAHLTLARVRDDADRTTREALFRALEPYLSEGTRTGNFRPELVPQFPRFPVRAVSLMESTLSRGGAVYHALKTFPLVETTDPGRSRG